MRKTQVTKAAPVALTCSECGIGNYHVVDPYEGNCDNCWHGVSLARDVEPWLDPTERLHITEFGLVTYITLEDD